MSMPPPLPDRPPSYTSSISSRQSSVDGTAGRIPRADTIHLTPHFVPNAKADNSAGNHPYLAGSGLDDPRSSSTQSLRPTESAGPNRRKLLLVYIHGFMGTETSFRSFPAHVHNLLSMTLSETHVVHSKIYPRYESRKNISLARDAFSNWLTPHEGANVDVVLLGHSLGGILASEVVLLPSHRPGSNDLFQHRILGQIAFDTPFLGMHPGVVSTGIASLFKSGPEIADSPGFEDENGPLSPNGAVDPNYNPMFPNDVNIPVRTKVDRALRFFNKHSEGFTRQTFNNIGKATTAYFKSYLDFGGCLADYAGLKKRYEAVRSLEDIDPRIQKRAANGKLLPRVRFVNYYTASTGRIKEPPQDQDGKMLVAETEMTNMPGPSTTIGDAASTRSTTPSVSLAEHTAGGVISKPLDDLHLSDTYSNLDHAEMQHVEPIPTVEDPSPIHSPALAPTTTDISLAPTGNAVLTPTTSTTPSQASTLPPLPAPPQPPSLFDPTPYTSSASLKAAQKEYNLSLKSYQASLKEYSKHLKDREKLLAKREKEAQKLEEKRLKAARAESDRIERENTKRQATLNQSQWDAALARQRERDAEAQQGAPPPITSPISAAPPPVPPRTSQENADKAPKKQRDRKFCSLPAKDPRTGERDPKCWIRVYMENMDEVVAHTSLFFVGETYAKLVGDVAERIEGWVEEDARRRQGRGIVGVSPD